MSKIEAGKMNLRLAALDVLEAVDDAVRLVRDRADAAGLQLVLDVPPTCRTSRPTSGRSSRCC